MANVLVLGGSGFIGLNLCDALLAQGHQVRSLGRTVPANVGSSRVEWVASDFNDQAAIKSAIAGQDVVFHLVSTTLPKTSNDDPLFDVQTNVLGSIQLLDICRSCSIRKIIFISSGGTVYGPPQRLPIPEDHPNSPTSSYGISKLTIERYLALYWHLHGLPYIVFRLSNPYGKYQRPYGAQGAIAVFLSRAMKGDPIEIWGDGSVVRDYIYISDVTNALVAAIGYEGNYRIFNVGSGIGRSLNDLAGEIETLLGRPVLVQYRPPRAVDVQANVLDASRLRAEFGWQPRVDLGEGLGMTMRYLEHVL